jgi:hypothetical protein
VLSDWCAMGQPSSTPRIVQAPLPDSTPERELDALAAVYRLVIDRCSATSPPDAAGGEPASPPAAERRSSDELVDPD